MIEFLELLLELILGATEITWAWRFHLGILASLAVASGICWLVPDDTVQVILSIPLVAMGAILGLAWERSSRRWQ